MALALAIVVKPSVGVGPGDARAGAEHSTVFDAWFGDRRIVKRSRSPIQDAARFVLASRHARPDDVLVVTCRGQITRVKAGRAAEGIGDQPQDAPSAPGNGAPMREA
jgi:hypothetical protein